MPDAQADPLSPHVEPAPAPARRLAVDPDERPVVVLSAESPPRRRNPRVRRAIAVAKRACLVVVVVVASLIVLAVVTEPMDEPVRAPTQPRAARG